MSKAKRKSDEPVVIKKYANRRLYDTGRSSYVTLDDLCTMVKDGYDFVVYDAKSGEDLTRSVLTQIIVDQESRGENLLPESFLKQLIGFYGENMQSLVPSYLEHTLQAFSSNQEQFQEQIQKSLGNMGGMINPMNSMGSMEELSRQNMAMFENAMRAWAPFTMNGNASNAEEKQKQKENDDKIQTLKENIEQMKSEIDRLSE